MCPNLVRITILPHIKVHVHKRSLCSWIDVEHFCHISNHSHYGFMICLNKLLPCETFQTRPNNHQMDLLQRHDALANRHQAIQS